MWLILGNGAPSQSAEVYLFHHFMHRQPLMWLDFDFLVPERTPRRPSNQEGCLVFIDDAGGDLEAYAMWAARLRQYTELEIRKYAKLVWPRLIKYHDPSRFLCGGFSKSFHPEHHNRSPFERLAHTDSTHRLQCPTACIARRGRSGLDLETSPPYLLFPSRRVTES